MRPTFAQERLHEAVLCLAVGTTPLRERLAEALRLAARARSGPGLEGRLRGELEAVLHVAAAAVVSDEGDDPVVASLEVLSDPEVIAIAETLVGLSWQLARERFAPTPASVRQARAEAIGDLELSDPEFALIFKCPSCRSEVDFGVGRGEPAQGSSALRICTGCGAALTLIALGDQVTVAAAEISL